MPNNIFKKNKEESEALLQHSQDNLDRGRYVIRDDGSISTVFSQTIETDNGYMVIPLIWDGKEVDTREAIMRSRLSGKKFPRASTIKEADAMAEALHHKMAKQKVKVKGGKSIFLKDITPELQQRQLKENPIEPLLNQMARIFIEERGSR